MKHNMNYIWQLQNSIYNLNDLPIEKLICDEISAIKKLPSQSIKITPYIYSLINFDDLDCPIRKQIIPREHQEYFKQDCLNELNNSITPLVVKKNKNRVLFLVSNDCAFNCTFCTRSRREIIVITNTMIQEAINAIKEDEDINEVIISGGDPLILSDSQLGNILKQLKNISHIQIIRIGTRIPVSMPMRITDKLIDLLKQFKPLYINIHINHPKEITDQSIVSINKLIDSGAVLGSQTVLLKGINDDYETLKELFQILIFNRVKPYYLFQCDKEKGCESFVVNEEKGVQLINKLQSNISGLAIPKYVKDTENKKILLGPCGKGE